MRYTATLTATFRIEAENIIEARRAAKRIRSVGECVGIRRPRKTRDSLATSVDRVSERVVVAKEGANE